ncbi:MAG: hypothetical protein ABIO70_31060 [Pseudomonadota bacterium]
MNQPLLTPLLALALCSCPGPGEDSTPPEDSTPTDDTGPGPDPVTLDGACEEIVRLGGWKTGALYLPLPYSQNKVKEMWIGAPSGQLVRTWNGEAVEPW